MIIKEADDKSIDIETLQVLAARPDTNADTRKRIEQEIRNIKAGARCRHRTDPRSTRPYTRDCPTGTVGSRRPLGRSVLPCTLYSPPHVLV